MAVQHDREYRTPIRNGAMIAVGAAVLFIVSGLVEGSVSNVLLLASAQTLVGALILFASIYVKSTERTEAGPVSE